LCEESPASADPRLAAKSAVDLIQMARRRRRESRMGVIRLSAVRGMPDPFEPLADRIPSGHAAYQRVLRDRDLHVLE
jgi:hypothetical protein